jgi:peptide/nickel transport system permease protein
MTAFLVRRLLAAIPLLIAISIMCFVVIQLPPGDFASKYKDNLIERAGMTEPEAERLARELRVQYGLDQPMPVQYLRWVWGIVSRGSFGFSFAYKKDVGELIAERLPRTILLALGAHFLATFFGVMIGIYSATHKYTLGDNLATVAAFLGMGVPRFFLALAVMYFLIFGLGQQHVGALYSPQYAVAEWSWAKFADLLKHVWPVLAIAGFAGMARNMRVMRSNLLDVLDAQYVVTARAKGLAEPAVVLKHAVPNALHPVVMYQGMALPYMLTGEMEVAIVMTLPTMAPMFYQSLINQDIYVSASFLLILAAVLVVGNLLADILLVMLDPRIRVK